MNQDRYTRVGNLLTTIRRLKEAREMVWLASVSCHYHDLRTVPGGLQYGMKVQDRIDLLDHLIDEMIADVDRECQYATGEREGEEGITLPVTPGPDNAA